MRRTILLAMGLLACAPSGDEDAGQETSPCNDGQCLGSLACLSNLCVDPQWEIPTPQEGTEGGASSGSDQGEDEASSSTSGPDGGSSGTAAAGDTTADGPAGGCEAVDILLVIDNSFSMDSKQERLRSALPEFWVKLEEATSSTDHHVMVVDTDAWVFEGCSALCGILPTCPGSAGQYICGVTQPEECEDVLGAGVTHPKGEGSAGVDCGLPPGKRYTNLADAGAAAQLDCVTHVGVGSSAGSELPMEAMLSAVGAIGDASACNEGFGRAGVPLIVVIATDEEEGPDDSMATPQMWHDGLVTARGGDASNITVLALLGDNDQPQPQCPPLDVDPSGGEPSPQLRAFVESFGDRGVTGSICEASYEQSFDRLVDRVHGLCTG